ncbi:MAG: type II toxin-antitoxin system PemK/MazF family toxin [Geminicoccales bacterium]
MAGFDNRAGFAFGDIVLASYATPHQGNVVQGPSVIISSTTYNQQRAEVLAMLIADLDRPNASSGEIGIQNIKAAGLDPGAALKPIIVTLEQKLVRLILGRLDERDRQSLRHLLNLILGD